MVKNASAEGLSLPLGILTTLSQQEEDNGMKTPPKGVYFVWGPAYLKPLTVWNQFWQAWWMCYLGIYRQFRLVNIWQEGMSLVKLIFNIVVESKVVSQEHKVWIHMCHILDKTMIITEIDGGYQVNDDADVPVGCNIWDLILLVKPMFTLTDNLLKRWCRGWMTSGFLSCWNPLTGLWWVKLLRFTCELLPQWHLWWC